MKERLFNSLRKKQGFVLAFVMLMIMLLMVFMTAIVTTVGYTNKVTAEKSQEHQLQLTAQSAVGTLKEMFAKEENMTKLTALAASGAEQDYDLSGAGINNKVKAKISDSGQPGYALLTVIAYDENGNEYTTTTLLPMVAAQGAKNDLIENMIVAYWPNANKGFTNGGLDYRDNVMNGTIIIDNEYYSGYGDADKYKNIIKVNGDNVSDTVQLEDPCAVNIKNGTFKELVTTGNLVLNPESGINGMGNTTIASAVGQLIVTRGYIGDGSNSIKELGAGGYYKDKGNSTDKMGNVVIGSAGGDGVEFKDAVDIISRDKVNVTFNKVSGKLKNCFVGGSMKFNGGSGKSLEVLGDMQVYKTATYDVTQNASKLKVDGDMASGTNTSITVKDSSASIDVGGAVVTANGNLSISGNSALNADYLLSGKGLTVSGAKANLSGGGYGYAAFSGGNYAPSNNKGSDYIGKGESNRGETMADGIVTSKPIVINNSKKSVPSSVTVLNKDSEEGLKAFKTMNSLWLTKAQKVYKGGWWDSCKNVKFAVALLFDPNIVPSSYINNVTEENKKSSPTESVFNPKPATGTAYTEADYKKNWQWYEMSDETYYGDKKVPVSHELYYTTNDSAFLLRSTLQSALGGPSRSDNTSLNANYQGRFVETARTAIPFDGAINEIQVQYPHYANFATSPTVDSADAGWASVQEYKDGYLIGSIGSTTGYANFGRVEFRNDSNKIYDGVNEYDVSGRTLYFRTTSPILPGGWGDFFFTSDNGEIKLNSKIVIEYSLNGTDAESLAKMGYVRIFLDPEVKLNLGSNAGVEGINNGSVNVNDVDFEYNNFHYTSIMPELYFFCAKPSQEAKDNFDIDTPDMDAFIIAPWSVVDMETVQTQKNNEAYKGIILCKNLVKAQSGTYNHHKPIAFGYAMSESVFVLPESNG